jgi:hypothetical protein
VELQCMREARRRVGVHRALDPPPPRHVVHEEGDITGG